MDCLLVLHFPFLQTVSSLRPLILVKRRLLSRPYSNSPSDNGSQEATGQGSGWGRALHCRPTVGAGVCYVCYVSDRPSDWAGTHSEEADMEPSIRVPAMLDGLLTSTLELDATHMTTYDHQPRSRCTHCTEPPEDAFARAYFDPQLQLPTRNSD